MTETRSVAGPASEAPLVLTLIAIVGLAVTAVFSRPVNHDAAWYLYMVDVWFHGGTPYRAAIDTNPPLIVLLTVPPVAIARLLHLSAIPAFQIYTFVLALISAAVGLRFAKRVGVASATGWGALVAALLPFLLLLFPKADYGQREHLGVIATLPYVLLAAVRAADAPVSTLEALLVGVAGAIGFAIKPHFLLAWLAVEGTLASQRGLLRSVRRPECLSAMATFVVYALVTAVAFPQYFEIAERVREVYGGLNAPVLQLANLKELLGGTAALAFMAVIKLPVPRQQIQRVLGAAVVGFLAAMLVQMKGWSYQLLPAQVYLAIFFVVAIVNVIEAAPGLAALIRGSSRGLTSVFCLGLVAMGAKYVFEARASAPNDLVTPLARLVRQYAPGGPIAVLGMRTLIYPEFPLVNETGARWSLRHNALWFLSGFYAQDIRGAGDIIAPHSLATMSPLERTFFDEIVEDLCANPPALLAVELPRAHAPGGRGALDLLAYYGQDPRIAQLVGGYREVATVPPFSVLTPAGQPSCR